MPASQSDSQNKQQPYLGQKDPKTGKVWAGDGWGYQAPATYTRLARQGQLDTQRNPLQWLDNNLRHLGKTTQSLDNGTKLVGTVGFLPIYEDQKGQFSTSTPTQRQVVAASTVQPAANAALAAVNLGQRLLSGQPLRSSRVRAEDTSVGRAIVAARTQGTVGMGAKPIEQLTQSQRDLLVSLPSSLATNTALAFVGPLRAAGPVVGQLAQKMPFLSAGAQQVLARGLAWGTNAAVNEGASSVLDDSTQGGAGDLLKAVGAPVPDAFLTKPGDDRIQAGLRSVIPGMVLGEGLGFAASFAGHALDLAPNAMRLLREQRVNGDLERVRQSTVAAGIQTPDAVGGYRFNRDIESSSPEPSAQTATPVGATAEQAATDAPLAPPPEIDLSQAGDSAMDGIIDSPDDAPAYDPSLLEVDAAALALDRLDDGALKAVAAGGGPVMPRLEEAMATQPRADVNPERSTTWTAAPAESLATPPEGWRSQWEQLPNTELIGAAAPTVSPDLFEKTQAITGKQWEEFTRSDVLDGLGALQQSGQVVLPQRLGGDQVLVNVQGLAVDPTRMQFRSGADPETGVAPGGPEISQWDPAKEGQISVWQDPQTGDQVLVDGHRRVEAAKRLGIPTLPAQELTSPNALAARYDGALTNIGQGSASPVDGGRALRELGVTDPAGLDAAGVPMEGGAASLSVARLPDASFRAAEAGRLPQGRAMAIGGSGLDETGMAAATRFSDTKAGQGLSDQEFAEVMSWAGSKPDLQGEGAAPLNSAAFAAGINQAKVAAAVRGQLPAELLPMFDQLKTQSGPIAQLLEEGGVQVGSGARPDVVANRVRLQVEEAAQAAQQAQPPAAGAAEAMAAEPQVDAPLSAADRQALRAQVLQQAVDGGEVRPSAQPIIPSPDPLSVDPIEGLRDLEYQLRNKGTIEPDTPAAQLLEEEARLADEYAARDAFIKNEMARAQREAAGFWHLSFDERLNQGLIGDGVKEKPKGWDVSEPTERPMVVDLGNNAAGLKELEAIAKRRALDSALELIEPNQVRRAKVLQRWSKDNGAAQADIRARLSDLDNQIAALKTQALTGGC